MFGKKSSSKLSCDLKSVLVVSSEAETEVDVIVIRCGVKRKRDNDDDKSVPNVGKKQTVPFIFL